MVHAMEVKVDVTLRLSKQLHESSMMYEKNQEYVDWPFLPHLERSPEAYGFVTPAQPLQAEEIPALSPSPDRVTLPEGSDILFYRGKPFLSFASKGNRSGFQHLEVESGFNTFYQEGRTFHESWPEGKPRPRFEEGARIFRDLAIARKFGVPFKTSMSLAHSTPFLPAWLVERENLGFEGHRMRRGSPTHASIFKPKTLDYYKQGLEGFIQPHLDQPTIFVFSQEDVPSALDDRSSEAQARWRDWLRRRFDEDFSAFSDYVGGVEGFEEFDAVPYPRRYEPHESVGHGNRLSWLKLVWVNETYGDFLESAFDHVRGLAPGIPLTQRYVYSPWGIYLGRRLDADYNYTFGHLTVEARAHVTGVGRKAWSAAHSHVGVLPLPRGGSIGKCWDETIRRGSITEDELRRNIFALLANGASGFEYSPFFPVWGERWQSAALYDIAGQPTPIGEIAADVFKEVLALSERLFQYETYPDAAVFHDAAANSRPFTGTGVDQSKYGLYTLIRETGYHSEPLTLWEMTEEALGRHRVVILAGTTAMAPEIQDSVRNYVAEGGSRKCSASNLLRKSGFPLAPQAFVIHHMPD